MKRYILSICTLLVLSMTADAQWYLFPNKNKNKEKKETPVQQEQNRQEAQEEKPVFEMEAEPVKDTVIVQTATDEYVYEKADVINAALLLPLNASGNPNNNFFELYCGAIMAARDLGNQGIRINLNVYDISDSRILKDSTVFLANDVILGPVTESQVKSALPYLPKYKGIISPLDPKVAELADSCKVIQAPAHWTSQYDELARWVAEENAGSSSKVIVIKDGNGENEQGNYLISRLEACNVRFECIGSINRADVPEGVRSYVIASDRDDFIATNIRELNLSGKKCIPQLYTVSRVRNLPLDPNALYRLNTCMTTNYHIDYNDIKVREFLLAYRALFNNEPGSFAFQGYDLTHYFVRMCSSFGRQWYKKVEDMSEKGLQSDFHFIHEDKLGHVNSAVRRIRYNSLDMSVTLE